MAQMSQYQRPKGIKALDGSPKSCSMRRYHGKHLCETNLNFGNWFRKSCSKIFSSFSSVGRFVLWSRNACAKLVKGIMINTCVIYFEFQPLDQMWL